MPEDQQFGDRKDPAIPTTRGMWLPLIAVIVVLAVLAVVPAETSVRVRRLRTLTSDVIDPARLHTSDVAASLAEEMFAVGMYSGAARSERSPLYKTAAASEHGDVLALDSLLRFVGPDAVERFAQYREAATRWHDDVQALIGQMPPTPAALDTARTDGLAALDADRRLTTQLDLFYLSARAEVRAGERIDVLLPVFLVPLALVACALVVRAGRGMVSIAVRADQDRRALARVMEQKSAFMRGMTHDLQNPLGAARGHVDLMLDGVIEPAEWRNALQRVRTLVARASETVAALLAVARSEAGEIPLARDALDLCALVRSAIEDHRSFAMQKQQNVSLDDADECAAVADRRRVRHIIDNLLSNSIKYTPPGGRVRVTVHRRARDGRIWSTVTVEDSGPGIPEEWRERIFEEFARMPGTSDMAAGTGIGLTVSRRVARIMGGDVTLEDRSPISKGYDRLGGAVFTLWLPASGDGQG